MFKIREDIIMNIKKSLTTAYNNTACFVKKNSPDILMGAGLISIAVGTIINCVNARKAARKAAYEPSQDEMILNEARETGSKKELTKAYVKVGFNKAKPYILGTAIEVAGAAACIGSHGILKTRNAELAVTCAALTKTIDSLKNAADKKFGEGAGDDIEKEAMSKNQTSDGFEPELSDLYYAFGPGDPDYYDQSPEQTLEALRVMETTANYLLIGKGNGGFVTLNEVRSTIGLPETKSGAVLGWRYFKNAEDNKYGDNYISFDLPEKLDDDDAMPHSGYIFYLRFNCDSLPIIYD